MVCPNSVSTEKWDANSVVLIQSRLAKMHRNMVLKRSMFHKLVTDKNKKILDLGCGSGPFLTYFASRGFQNLYGIEPDAELIKNIPGNINAEIRNCRAEYITFDDCTFDVVFIYGVFHHLKGSGAYKAACNEIYRVLKPDGLLFIMEPGTYWTFRMVEIVSKFLGFFSKTLRAFSECIEEERPELHFFLKNHDVVRDDLVQRGFKIFIDKYFIYTWIFTAQKIRSYYA